MNTFKINLKCHFKFFQKKLLGRPECKRIEELQLAFLETKCVVVVFGEIDLIHLSTQGNICEQNTLKKQQHVTTNETEGTAIILTNMKNPFAVLPRSSQKA
jgi:hypothetical protein